RPPAHDRAAAEQLPSATIRWRQITPRTAVVGRGGAEIDHGGLRARRAGAAGGQGALVAPDRRLVVELDGAQHAPCAEIMAVRCADALAGAAAIRIAAGLHRDFAALHV